MYLLDTCAFIWTVKKEAKMSSDALDILKGYEENLTLITNDSSIMKYEDIKTLW